MWGVALSIQGIDRGDSPLATLSHSFVGMMIVDDCIAGCRLAADTIAWDIGVTYNFNYLFIKYNLSSLSYAITHLIAHIIKIV